MVFTNNYQDCVSKGCTRALCGLYRALLRSLRVWCKCYTRLSTVQGTRVKGTLRSKLVNLKAR